MKIFVGCKLKVDELNGAVGAGYCCKTIMLIKDLLPDNINTINSGFKL